jgi:hypothetical protein
MVKKMNQKERVYPCPSVVACPRSVFLFPFSAFQREILFSLSAFSPSFPSTINHQPSILATPPIFTEHRNMSNYFGDNTLINAEL